MLPNWLYIVMCLLSGYGFGCMIGVIFNLFRK